MIRREAHSIGELDAGEHYALVALAVDEPYAVVRRIAKVHVVAPGYGEIVRIYVVCEYRLGAVRRVGYDAPPCALANV